jgi:hypothetical protein
MLEQKAVRLKVFAPDFLPPIYSPVFTTAATYQFATHVQSNNNLNMEPKHFMSFFFCLISLDGAKTLTENQLR